MIEILVALMVVGAGMIVFYPWLAGREAPRPVQRDRGLEDDQTELRERKRRLLRNLQELEKEKAAGRVAEVDYLDLKERDTAEAAQVIEQLEKADADIKSGRRPSKKPAVAAAVAVPPRQKAARAAAWVGGILAFGAAIAFTMSRAITDRQPGGTITGTIPGNEGAPAPGGGGGGGGGAAFMPAGDPVRLAALEKALRTDSNNLKNLLEAGHLYLGERRLDEGAQVTLRALKIDSTAPEAHAHMGVLLMAAGIPDTALMALDYAISKKPDLAEAWLFKGMVYMAGKQDQAHAVDAWEQYLKVAPKGADTARIAAMVRAFKGR